MQSGRLRAWNAAASSCEQKPSKRSSARRLRRVCRVWYRADFIKDCDRPEAVYITARWSNMSPIAFLLNLLWIVFGGLWRALGWVIAAVVMAITIIGIPWARAAFNIASYTLLPFGRRAVSRVEYSGRNDLGTGPFGLIGNIIWLVLAGWWLALGHVLTAIVLAVTIIGIPFAWAHLKLAGIALWPIGKEIVAADAVPFRQFSSPA